MMRSNHGLRVINVVIGSIKYVRYLMKNNIKKMVVEEVVVLMLIFN
jgi:hypothetical protein